MPKLKEVSEIIESDPSLGEQITVFEDKDIKECLSEIKEISSLKFLGSYPKFI